MVKDLPNLPYAAEIAMLRRKRALIEGPAAVSGPTRARILRHKTVSATQMVGVG